MNAADLALFIGGPLAAILTLISTIQVRRSASMSELRGEVAALRREVHENFDHIQTLRDALDEQRVGISLLVIQILELGALPVWTPKKGKQP